MTHSCCQGKMGGCNSKDSCKKVPFEVVTIYTNDIYRPYTITPISCDSAKVYAIKIGTDYFILGEAGRGVHICDLHQEQATPDDKKAREV